MDLAMQLGPYTIIYLVAALLALSNALRFIARRNDALPLVFAALPGCATIWIFLNAVESAIIDPAVKMAVIQAAFPFGIMPLALLPIIVAKMVDNGMFEHIVPRLILFGAVALLTAAAWTNGWHHAMWTGYLPGLPGTNSLRYLHGPAYAGVPLLMLVITAITIRLLTQKFRHKGRYFLFRNIAVGVAGSFPVAAMIIMQAGLNPWPGLNLIPLGFAGSVLVYWLVIERLKLLSLLPIAKTLVFDSLENGLLVMDNSFRLLDFNASAQRLLGQHMPLSIGDALSFPDSWNMRGTAGTGQSPYRDQIVISSTAGESRYLSLSFRQIQKGRNKGIGQLLVVADITSARLSEEEIRFALHKMKKQYDQIIVLDKRLKELVSQDSLTGLLNRRALDEIVPRELERARRFGTPLSLVIIDLDHFKDINDKFGHGTGDQVLIEFARFLQNYVRGMDYLFRMGGDEFVILFPGMEAGQARNRMKKALAETEALRISGEGTETGGGQIVVKFTAGVAEADPSIDATGELLALADKRLYMAKREGRAQIR